MDDPKAPPPAGAAAGGPAAPAAAPAAAAPAGQALGGAMYDIIRQRLQTQGEALRERMAKLDARRQEVFGTIEHKLLQADRISTAHNCEPRDMIQLGAGRFLFGFNVHFGLKKEIDLADVFAIYSRDEAAGTFKEADLEVLNHKAFLTDFKRLYNVYEKATFRKFSLIDGSLYMVFQTGAGLTDMSVFKWAYRGGQLVYVDGRAESEFRRVGFPTQYNLPWKKPDRESFRYGDHPHISIEDRVFVESVGGDLTIKVEDNTSTGEGVYAEPVEDKHQKVDDAEIEYAIHEHLILLKIRPYKETAARYFIFNEKSQTAVRVDSIGQSCVLLPENHGLIFPDGYYLASGELKRFENKEKEMAFEHVIHAPNGEDSLYVFHNFETGAYVLMPYRLIAQKVEERITCHGYSLFPNGQLVHFRADGEPKKHHMVQLRQTPFHEAGFEPPGKRDAFLYQVGNKDVVRCLAESNEVLTLVRKDNPYAALYLDLVKRTGAILDAYPWLSTPDGFQLDVALRALREAADKAVDEFEKVRRLQREAVDRVKDVRQRTEEHFRVLRRTGFNALNDFVTNLAGLRHLRGEIITLKDVRYVELPPIQALEQEVLARTTELSGQCVKFLLKPAALEPYRKQAAEHLAQVEKVTKVAEGKVIEQAVAKAGTELELLIEIVNSLKIDDATETTRIIDSITGIYSTLNQVKGALKKRLQSLSASEGAAQFSAQMKLLGQAASSYLDLCDSPAKCDEYLNKITVQIEEMEGVFADFEEYTVQLSDKRTELYEAFEQRKVALVEQRNRRANALMTAAERILKVVQNRLAGFKSLEDINTYMASDLMIEKIRETIAQLLETGDSVKADDLQGRLKSLQQEAVRQLKDRQDLFAGGANLIQLGKHRFNVNTQPLELTIVIRDDVPHVHLTSTKYFEPVKDEAFLATREAWGQEVVSENADVYRAEYLAYALLKSLDTGSGNRLAEALGMPEAGQFALVQEFMGSRYQEGYTKGIHDHDGAKIFHALLHTHVALKLARFAPTARAAAVVYWHRFCPEETRLLWTAKLNGFAARNKLFPGDITQRGYIGALQALLAQFLEETGLYPKEIASPAGEYLFYELIGGGQFVVSQEADQLVSGFRQHLVSKGGEDDFAGAVESLAGHPISELELTRDWVRGFAATRNGSTATHLDEAAAILFCGDQLQRELVLAGATQTLDGIKGTHAIVKESKYHFDYLGFTARLQKFERDVVPRFEQYHTLKQQLLERERVALRLDEFKPRVLSSFVRNQLIDQVYLPLVGDNLAKQIGAAGDKKRTDLMGLLLLISPPGYGKTTLVEYVSNRLGIIFIKINGPAIGHEVTSLDPTTAPNSAAREEILKLNLALEMGDNVMICVDDIQHCNPEFLQKFISLCDGQRKIEGQWRGRARTYDLRGRKVVVVMAGNPYTESGQKFKIPDMLSNRADTYNLGDIIGGSADWFKASYVENAVTSNAVLAPLANKSQKDIRAFLKMAELGTRDAESLEGNYSANEMEEVLGVMKRLVSIREVILKVNLEYIHSAAQADEFRTEPPFKLQGSYRNMNRLAEKVVPIMNEAEVQGLILDHYRNESQTLTTGAESNLLKFKELIGRQTPEEAARWAEIKKTFKRNQTTRGGDGADPVGRLVSQLSAFQGGLESIQETLEKQLSKPRAPVNDFAPLGKELQALRAVMEERMRTPLPAPPPPPAPAPVAPPVPVVVHAPAPTGEFSQFAGQLNEGLRALRQDLSAALTEVHKGSMAQHVERLAAEMEAVQDALAKLSDLTEQQRSYLQATQASLAERARQGRPEMQVTEEMLNNEQVFLENVRKMLSAAAQAKSRPAPPAGEAKAATPPPLKPKENK